MPSKPWGRGPGGVPQRKILARHRSRQGAERECSAPASKALVLTFSSLENVFRADELQYDSSTDR